MSTFAVFGMTRDYAYQHAFKNTPTVMFEKTPNVLGEGKSRELTENEWLAAVDANTEKMLKSKRVTQLSQLFDTPHFASDYIRMLRKRGGCRDLVIKYKRRVEPKKGSKKPFSLKWEVWEG